MQSILKTYILYTQCPCRLYYYTATDILMLPFYFRPSEAYKLKEEGSLILLAMFDAETRGNNGFKGLCVVECKSTPQGYELKMEHQNLFHYRQTKAHEEIERRSSESLAKNFLKLLKRFIPNDDKQSTLQLISLQSGIDHISRLKTLGRSLQIRQQKPMTSH